MCSVLCFHDSRLPALVLQDSWPSATSDCRASLRTAAPAALEDNEGDGRSWMKLRRVPCAGASRADFKQRAGAVGRIEGRQHRWRGHPTAQTLKSSGQKALRTLAASLFNLCLSLTSGWKRHSAVFGRLRKFISGTTCHCECQRHLFSFDKASSLGVY